jgi:hypothetical protein
VYSLWCTARLPLCLAQAAAVIIGHALRAQNSAIQNTLLFQFTLYAAVCAAGYRFHRLCMGGLEELGCPPLRLKKHCIMFAALMLADAVMQAIGLHLVASNSQQKYYEDFRVPESLIWITVSKEK